MNLFDRASPTEIEQPVTCAIAVITPTNKILLAHPVGSGYLGAWSLPKGIKDRDEAPATAAVRELSEETGINIDESKLVDLGRFSYLPKKDYHLFIYRSPTEVEVKELFCESTFVGRDGQPVPEVDRYQLADVDYALRLLNPKQSKIIASVRNKIT